MQGKGKGSVSLSFSSEKYDKVYFPERVDGVPVLSKVYGRSEFATCRLVTGSPRCHIRIKKHKSTISWYYFASSRLPFSVSNFEFGNTLHLFQSWFHLAM
jgi:hypothetical protein